MDELLKYGEVQRGTIPGISIANLTTQIAEELGAPNTRGALVNQISPRAEAYLAGLRAGDIIISFNGRSVEDASALMRMLADSKIGTAARLEILRESRRLEVTVPVTRSRSTQNRPIARACLRKGDRRVQEQPFLLFKQSLLVS